jgi:DNA invertase Pin-like site-specific DNA recombinase
VSPNAGERMVGSASATGLERGMNQQRSTISLDCDGLSGGTMERPALQRLLADIGAALVDVVVVYNVDRLTRALTDFAKMVEVFDARGYLSSP